MGFLKNFRNSIRRLAERLNLFLQFIETTEVKGKFIITPALMNQFHQIDDVLDECCQILLKQPLPDKQLFLMTDASLQAKRYAVLMEDDPN